MFSSAFELSIVAILALKGHMSFSLLPHGLGPRRTSTTTAIISGFICCLRIDLFMAHMACDLSDYFSG